eukprot:363254-Chlamydomonas_euryale.AAC.4
MHVWSGRAPHPTPRACPRGTSGSMDDMVFNMVCKLLNEPSPSNLPTSDTHRASPAPWTTWRSATWCASCSTSPSMCATVRTRPRSSPHLRRSQSTRATTAPPSSWRSGAARRRCRRVGGCLGGDGRRGVGLRKLPKAHSTRSACFKMPVIVVSRGPADLQLRLTLVSA